MFDVELQEAIIQISRQGLRFMPVPLIAEVFLNVFAGPPMVAGLGP